MGCREARRREHSVLNCYCPRGPLCKLAEVADQDHAIGVFAFGEEQLFTIAGPGKIEDAPRSEVGHRTRSATDEWLLPNVSGAVRGQEVLQALLIGRPVQAICAAGPRKDVQRRSAGGGNHREFGKRRWLAATRVSDRRCRRHWRCEFLRCYAPVHVARRRTACGRVRS
jgi:hypothetical protein